MSLSTWQRYIVMNMFLVLWRKRPLPGWTCDCEDQCPQSGWTRAVGRKWCKYIPCELNLSWDIIVIVNQYIYPQPASMQYRLPRIFEALAISLPSSRFFPYYIILHSVPPTPYRDYWTLATASVAKFSHDHCTGVGPLLTFKATLGCITYYLLPSTTSSQYSYL